MSEENLALIVPAAGSGKRLGTELPKPYLIVNGKTILQHTLENFIGVSGLTEVVISTSEAYRERSEKIINELFPKLQTKVVLGGKERQDSILNAINALSAEIGFVAIHDAVRPLIETEHIRKCFQEAKISGAAIVAVPAKDTVKVSGKDGFVTGTPDRNMLWHAQTPQIFEIELLKKAYSNARKKNIFGTDDSFLVEQVGGNVGLIEGSWRNFKITYPLDLEFAEYLLKK